MSQNIDKLKRTQIKPHTKDKKYKIMVDGRLVMSYNDLELAKQCARVLNGKLLIPLP